MDLTAQIYFLGILVLTNGHLPLGIGPPGHRDPGPPDLLDPLHLNPGRRPFDHHSPGPDRHHHRDHGMLEDFLDPLFGSDENNEGRYNQNNIRVTTDRAPLKLNLLPNKSNLPHKNDVTKPLGTPVPKNNTQPEKNLLLPLPAKIEQTKPPVEPPKEQHISPPIPQHISLPIPPQKEEHTMPPKVPVNQEQTKSPIIPPKEDHTEPPIQPAKEELILRTNENKTVPPKALDNQISKSNDNTNVPGKLPVTQQNTHPGDSIVFPDNVEEMKSKFKDGEKHNSVIQERMGDNNHSNKTCDSVGNNINNLNVSDNVNMTKNRDGVFIPVQAMPVNPVQDTNGKFLLVPINPTGNSQNQALPITNDIFPSRAPVYTTVRPGQMPIYTNVINTIPANAQPTGNNGISIYYQRPDVLKNPNYNTVSNPNGNNWVPNIGAYNPNLSSNTVNNSPMNVGNRQVPSNSGISTMYNSNSQQQPTTNGYNNQPNYNNQQGNLYPARNLQDNVPNQQTNLSGNVPTYNNVQGISSQNNVPNYNGNNGQTYMPLNIGPNSEQSNTNGQQYYVIPNNQLNNNMNTARPLILNMQGNAISNQNNGNNNQQYMLVNANQLNIPQNGQGNNIYTLQNGQLVALVPVQIANGGLVNNNNGVNQMTPVNSNIVQPNIVLPNTMNSQPNGVTMNSNPNQPNLILMNGNSPNGAVLLNGQANNINSQISVPSSTVILNGQATNLNGQNSMPNGAIIVNGQTTNLNSQNSMPNGAIMVNDQATNLNSQNLVPSSAIILNGQATNLNGQTSVPNNPIILNSAVLGNSQTPTSNGPNLYTMVTVPNNYVSSVGNSYQVPGSVNLVNTRDKAGKEDLNAAGNNTI